MHELVLSPHLSLIFCYPLLHAWACVVPILIVKFLLSRTSCMSLSCPHIKFLLSPTSCMSLCCPHIKFLLPPTSCMSLCCRHTYHLVSAIPYFMHESVLSPYIYLSFCYPLLHAWACVVPTLSFYYLLLHAWSYVVPTLGFCYQLLHA